MKRRRNGSRIMWKERPLWQESELKMQRQQLNRSRIIWEMLKRQDWKPPSLKQHFRRCWTPSEIAWVILQVPTMKKIPRGASLAKMTNPGECWAQPSKRYCIACRVIGRSSWSLTNWCNQAGETRPTTSVRGIRRPGQLNGRLRLLFNLKWQMMQRYLCRRHLVNLWRLFIASPENRKCRKWLLDQSVVIGG